MLGSVDRKTQERLLSSKANYSFWAKKEENNEVTPFDLAFLHHQVKLQYYLRYFLEGGEFGKETSDFYKIMAGGVSNSASKIQD